MPCNHKFFGHPSHQVETYGLIPNWNFKTLIIGTFNPENYWNPNNNASYFYGRSRYFWKLIGKFGLLQDIDKIDIINQFQFLQKRQVGLTDLLIRIEDANLNNPDHVAKIRTYKDRDIESFNNLVWNTEQIINTIEKNRVNAVYFTCLGNPNKIYVPFNSFENQMRIISNFCDENGILNYRLHSPSGQGLGKGAPRENKLINKWYFENGAQNFPFISPDFDINEYPFN